MSVGNRGRATASLAVAEWVRERSGDKMGTGGLEAWNKGEIGQNSATAKWAGFLGQSLKNLLRFIMIQWDMQPLYMVL